MSAVAAVGAAAVGVLLEPPSSSALLAFAVVIPVVLVQDTWRFVCIVDRAGTALLLDVVWLVAVCGVLAAAPEGAGAGWFVAAWGLSAAPAVAVAALADRRFLTWRLRPLRWLVAERATTSRFFGEYLTAQAGQQLTLAAVSGLAGIAALGAVRASQILYGPLNTSTGASHGGRARRRPVVRPAACGCWRGHGCRGAAGPGWSWRSPPDRAARRFSATRGRGHSCCRWAWR